MNEKDTRQQQVETWALAALLLRIRRIGEKYAHRPLYEVRVAIEEMTALASLPEKDGYTADALLDWLREGEK